MQSKFVERLNEYQREAVLTTEGTIQICSVAGSGKTETLKNRIAHMVSEKGINPDNILVTTFTAKAAKEISERLETVLPKKQIEALTMGTFHSIGYRIIREEFPLINHPMEKAVRRNPNEGILKGWKKEKIVNDIIKNIKKMFGFNWEAQKFLNQAKAPLFLKVVSDAKGKNISPDEYYMQSMQSNSIGTQVLAEFYKQYEAIKQHEQVIDFDDMLYFTFRMFKKHPEILAKYQDKFKYLMVDEAQDNNWMQYQLVKMLSFPENNLFIVGDDDQSMYKFRGATPEEFIDFKDTYKNVKQIFLPLNYRSYSGILEVANKLIHNNRNRIEKRLISASGKDGKSVFYNVYRNEDEEAQAIVEEVKVLEKESQYPHEKIAVLYRTNAQSRAMEDALIMEGIPYTLHGSVGFYERKEIKDLIAYFQLAYNTDNDDAFQRIYNTPTRYLGREFIANLKSVKGNSMFDAMDLINLRRNQKQNVAELQKSIEVMQKLSENGSSLESILDYIMDEVGGEGYRKFLLSKVDGVEEEDVHNNEEDKENPRLANIETFRHLLSHFETLEGFMNHIDKVVNSKKESNKGIQLMTIHRSKGLEFKAVFGIGMCDGLLPHAKALEVSHQEESDSPIEEERRLAYVLVTRAEEKCYLSSTESYNGREQCSSRFIDEMELEPEVKEGEEEEKAV